MNAIYILWLRQLKRYIRSRPRVVASLAQPLLFLFALGFGFGPIFEKAGHGSYIQFIAPGVMGMTVLFYSMFSGVAAIDHDRAHPGRGNNRSDSRTDRNGRLLDRWI